MAPKPSVYSDLLSSRSSAKSCSLFLAKGGLTEHLASPPWPTRGGNLHGGTQQLGDRITPRPPVVGVQRSYRGGCSPCGSCLSHGCSCYRPPGRRRTCPACGWRRAPRHSRWAAGREVERAAGRAPRLPPPRVDRWAVSAMRPVVLVLQCLTTSHFPDTQTPRRSVSLQDVPSRAGTMSCRWPSTVVQCRSHGLLEMWT